MAVVEVSVSFAGPVLTRAVVPVPIALVIVRACTALTTNSPLPESVPPEMPPMVLPISPPEFSVRVQPVLIVTPTLPVRFRELNVFDAPIGVQVDAHALLIGHRPGLSDVGQDAETAVAQGEHTPCLFTGGGAGVGQPVRPVRHAPGHAGGLIEDDVGFVHRLNPCRSAGSQSAPRS
jgi:hypothetical protein